MAKRKANTNRILCSFCDASHYVKEGGWVVAGNGKIYCHSLQKSCLIEKHNQEGNYGKHNSIFQMWEDT
jgi:hypothetical protein